MDSNYSDKLLQSINKLNDSINNFDFMLSHQEMHLEDYIFDIKNKIDIQREEMIQKIHKVSNEMIEKIDKHHQDCLKNLSILNETTQIEKDNLNKLRFFLDERKLDAEAIKIEELDTIEEEIDSILKEINISKENYDNQLKMNSNYAFNPVKFNSYDDLFGRLDKKLKDDFKFSVVKSFSSPLVQELYSNIDIFDDYKLAISNDLDEILQFDLKSAECLLIIKDCHDLNINCLKWISKSILASGADDLTIKLWNENGEIIHTLISHEKPITNLCFNPQKNHLISSSSDGQIKIWSLTNYECLKTLTEHKMDIFNLLLNQNEYLASMTYDRQIKVWNSNDNYECIFTIKNDAKLSFIELTPIGNLVCVSYNSIEILDILTGERINYIDIFNEGDDEYYMTNIEYLKFISESMILVIFQDETELRPYRMGIFDLNQEKFKNKINYIPSWHKIHQFSMLKNGDLVVLSQIDYEDDNENENCFSLIKIIKFY